MPGLSNDYIEKLMYKLSVNPQKFKGVKPCDIFLNEIEQNQYSLEGGDSIIINLSSSNNSGSHFVSIHISFNSEAEYFDSFGLPSFDSNINNAFREANLSVLEFETSIQDISSQFCGFYCIAYLIWRELGLEKTRFAQLFNANSKIVNDTIVFHLSPLIFGSLLAFIFFSQRKPS